MTQGHGKGDSRVLKFDRDGKFIKTWGKKGTAPGEFDNPHSLAMDSRERLFVADRSNRRIQIFDQEGRFLEEWKQFGITSELFIDRHDVLYSADSTSTEKTAPGWRRGIVIGSAKTGEVTAFIPDPDVLGGTLELITADAKGNLFGGLTLGSAVKKFVTP